MYYRGRAFEKKGWVLGHVKFEMHSRHLNGDVDYIVCVEFRETSELEIQI